MTRIEEWLRRASNGDRFCYCPHDLATGPLIAQEWRRARELSEDGRVMLFMRRSKLMPGLWERWAQKISPRAARFLKLRK